MNFNKSQQLIINQKYRIFINRTVATTNCEIHEKIDFLFHVQENDQLPETISLAHIITIY